MEGIEIDMKSNWRFKATNPTLESTTIDSILDSISHNLDFASELEGTFEDKFKLLYRSMRSMEKDLYSYFLQLGVLYRK